jgi:hypothetical protein
MTNGIAGTERERRMLRRIGAWGLFWTALLAVALLCAPLASQSGG